MRDNDTSLPEPGAGAHHAARTAGLAYLITIVAGLTAEVYVRSSIRARDPVVTRETLRTFEPLYRLGVFADGVMLISYIVVTAMLYRLFKPVSASVSFLAALFSIIGIALLASSLTILVLPLHIGGPSIAHDALRAHSAAFNLTGLFFGPYCALIGWLALRSRWLPAWIGWLMVLAGLVFVFDATVELVAPGFARQIPEVVMLVSLMGEGSLAVWLALVGARPWPRGAAD